MKLHNVLLVGDVSEGGDEIPEEGIVLKTGSRGQMSHKHTLVFWLSSSFSYSSQSVLLDNNTKVIRGMCVFVRLRPISWTSGKMRFLLLWWSRAKATMLCSSKLPLIKVVCSSTATAAHRNKAAALPQ